jgi:hypothetical protein
MRAMMRPADAIGFAAGAFQGPAAHRPDAGGYGHWWPRWWKHSLGEAARLYVTGQFAELGTNLLIVLPGRSETTGGPPPLTGETPRDLTIEDSQALARSRRIRFIAPLTVGSAPVSWQQREREVMVLGSTACMYQVRHLKMSLVDFCRKVTGQSQPVACLGPPWPGSSSAISRPCEASVAGASGSSASWPRRRLTGSQDGRSGHHPGAAQSLSTPRFSDC